MKIILFTKSTLLINIFIIYLIVFLLFFILHFYNKSLIEITCNSEISSNWMNKTQNLTNEKDKIAYLTFDDGPTTSVTPQILDILKEKNITATFFVLGKSVEAHPEIVQRAYEEGHSVTI